MPPAGEIARAVADDRIGRQRLTHRHDARAEIQRHALARPRRRPGVIGVVRLQIVRLCRAVDQRQRLAELRHGGADREIGAVGHAELGGVRMDVDEPLPRMLGRDQRIAVGGRLPQPRADHQQQIGVLHPSDQRRIGAVAQIARIGRAAVGHRILAPERGDQRHAGAVRPGGDVLPRRRIPARTADDRHRPLCRGDEVGELLHRIRIGRLADALDARAIGGFHLIEQHVLGQRQHHRAGAPVHRHSIGARDIFWDAPRIVDPRRPFGDGREHCGEIHLLERLAIARAAIDVADEQDHRLRILHRDMDANRRIGRARPAGDEGDPRPVRQRAVGARHEGDATLLPAGDDVDFGRIDQRVEHRQEALPRHGEDPVAALQGELIDQDAAAGADGGLHVPVVERSGRQGNYPPRLRRLLRVKFGGDAARDSACGRRLDFAGHERKGVAKSTALDNPLWQNR